MKFALASDLHLYYGPVFLENTEDADVLVLAGDIYEAELLPTPDLEFNYIRVFFRDIASKFKHVLWVAGNHEHYGTMYPTAHDKIRRWLKDDPLLTNIQFLEQQTVEVEGVLFHGTTLWTDIKKHDPLIAQQVAFGIFGMNDFSEIQGWNTYVQYHVFKSSFYWLSSALKLDKKNVVITHHHPCSLSIGNHYFGDPLNYAYFTELSEFIFDHQEIKFWCCGHIHEHKYYSIDETYVVCNPRGYADEIQPTKDYKLRFYNV